MVSGASALPEGLRRATDEDAEQLITLVGAAYDEHPGCVMDLPGIDDDLPAPGTVAGRRGSPWWVVERAGRIVATVGAGPLSARNAVELKRLYVDAAHRGRGLATALVHLVEGQAAGLGATAVELWSDTRFTDAHRRYEALGYTRTGETRQLHDPSDTTEYCFVREVTPRVVTRSVTWDGPHGREVGTLIPLPTGWLLTSTVGGGAVVSRVEVDEAWRTRGAEVHLGPDRTRRVTSDAHGAWWVDGRLAPQLDGAVDVDLEVTPLTTTLPIRRLLGRGRPQAEVRSVLIRHPGGEVAAVRQRYEHLGDRRWRRTSGDAVTELTVDEDGLVVGYGELWSSVV